MRAKAGDHIVVADDMGKVAECEITGFTENTVELKLLQELEERTESPVEITLVQCLPKGDKLELITQKATELGAYEIVAFPSARCISRPDEKSISKKLERWQKIAASAAEQSGRGRIPKVLTLPSYKAALERAAQADKALLFYENEQATTLRMALSAGTYETVSLLTGPEGGLEVSEVQQAQAAGLQVCTLGKRILRCETAPLCALSAVMYDAGEF